MIFHFELGRNYSYSWLLTLKRLRLMSTTWCNLLGTQFQVLDLRIAHYGHIVRAIPDPRYTNSRRKSCRQLPQGKELTPGL